MYTTSITQLLAVVLLASPIVSGFAIPASANLNRNCAGRNDPTILDRAAHLISASSVVGRRHKQEIHPHGNSPSPLPSPNPKPNPNSNSHCSVEGNERYLVNNRLALFVETRRHTKQVIHPRREKLLPTPWLKRDRKNIRAVQEYEEDVVVHMSMISTSRIDARRHAVLEISPRSEKSFLTPWLKRNRKSRRTAQGDEEGVVVHSSTISTSRIDARRHTEQEIHPRSEKLLPTPRLKRSSKNRRTVQDDEEDLAEDWWAEIKARELPALLH